MKFQPKAEKGSVAVRFVDGSLNKFVDKVVAQELHIGTGLTAENKKQGLNRRKYILLMRKVIAVAKQNRIKSIAVDFTDLRALAPKPAGKSGEDFSDNEVGRVVAESFVMANYEHNTYKTKPKEGFASVEVVAVLNTPEPAKRGGQPRAESSRVEAGFWVGEQIGAEVNACRELANMPGGDMTPKVLAEAAKKALRGTKASVKVLGRKELQKLGMGAILGIAKGSSEEPQFIVMEYFGAPKSEKPIVLVGKGVTFDTGGLNVKPGDHMYEMHMDMSGGASVIHAVALCAKLKVRANVVGLIPAVENMPSGNAVRPGDILKSLSGKTIEVLNTDAEGRVILADGITYAKRYQPRAVIDVATLTGAAFIAIGTQASCFMTNDDTKIHEIMDVAEASGDYMWPLPAWEEYEAMVKGTFGDVPNLSADGNSRDGGVIAGGMFLWQFAKELGCPWIHIDMAPRMTARPDEYLARGAAGAPVRFLLKFIEDSVK